jgi:hypothetical protein
MKKSESNLWKRIKNLKLKGQLFRIESNTINGIPDVYWLINNKSIWIELKSNAIKNLGLSKYQIKRECLSQGSLSEYQIFVVREPRTVKRAYSSLKLIDAIKFLSQ